MSKTLAPHRVSPQLLLELDPQGNRTDAASADFNPRVQANAPIEEEFELTSDISPVNAPGTGSLLGLRSGGRARDPSRHADIQRVILERGRNVQKALL